MSTSEEIDAAARSEALQQLHKLGQKKAERDATRQSNSKAAVLVSRREHEANKKQLKSDLKKTSTFVNKLRSMNTEAIQQCIRDVETLNLTLYVSEIVAAITDISFKPTDVPAIVLLATALHKRYEEFTTPLVEKILTALFTVAGPGGASQPPAEDADGGIGKKRRIQIRLLLELFEAGLCSSDDFSHGPSSASVGLFLQLARVLTGRHRLTGEKVAKQPLDLMGFSTFIKYCAEPLLGMPSKSLHQLARTAGLTAVASTSIPINLAASETRALEARTFILDVYQQLCSELTRSHKEYKKRERKAEKDRLIHGSLNEQKQLELDQSKRMFERLFSVLTGVADSLGEDLPNLQGDELDEEELAELAAANSGKVGISVWEGLQQAEYNGPFGDPESRAFYEDLPDLLVMVPLTVLGISTEQAATLKEQWKAYKESRYTGAATASGGSGNEDDASAVSDELSSGTTMTADEGMADTPSENISASEGDSTTAELSETSGDPDNSTPQARVALLLEDKLPECNTRAKCDEFCVNFCLVMNNNKAVRKKLALALAKIPRNRGELVSTYARIVASMHRIYPNDVASVVLDQVMREITFLSKTKTQFAPVQVETKTRSLRYLGELVKFGVAPPISALRAFKAFLADFSSHNVDFMTTLLESCGRLLYLLPHTSDRIQSILDTMLRLRRSRFLDLRQQSLVDSAYFAVKPPDKSATKKKETTTVQRYIKYLILDRLCHPKVFPDEVILSLRRLPWQVTSEDVTRHVVKNALKVARHKYICVGALADCLAGVLRYRPNVVISLVDTILEELFRGMDMPFKRDPQRMIGYVRLLGEMYNYQILSSTVIFDTFYIILHYGHTKVIATDANNASMDSTNHVAVTPVNSILAQPQYAAVLKAAAIHTQLQIESQGPDSGAASSDALATTSTAVTNSIESQPPADKPLQMQQRTKLLITTLLASRFDPSQYDPRVPADIDPPYDHFRSQLIVELVNTCGEYFVKGANKEKFAKFLLYFQRYLLCKPALPLHVEFAVLDMFDQLESIAKEGLSSKEIAALLATSPSNTVFPRYTSLEIVQGQVEGFEADIKAAEAIRSNNINNNTGIDADEEEDLDENDDDDNGDDGDDNGNDGEEGENEEQDENEEGEGEGEDGDEGDDVDAREEEEEEAIKLINYQRVVEEDEDFEKAFRAVVTDSIESVSRMPGVFKATDIDRMAIPAVLPKPKNLLRPIIQPQMTPAVEASSGADSESAPAAASSGGGSGKVFKLLARDAKGRVETRQMLVPEDNSMVIKLQKSEEAQRLERQKIKERVLQYEAMMSEEAELEHTGSFFDFGKGTAYTAPRADTQGGRGSGGRGRGGRGGGRASGHAGGAGAGTGDSSATGGQRVGGVTTSSGAYIYGRRPTKEEEMRKPAGDTLNLDQFLAESDKAELRRLQQIASGVQQSNPSGGAPGPSISTNRR